MDISELNLSVRDYNAVKRFGISSAEELVERLPYFCEHAKATAGRVTEALHECGMLPFKLGQWVEPDQCGEEIEPEELEAGDFVVMGFPTESKDWRKVIMICTIDGDELLYLDGSGGAPHCRLDDRRVWSIRSEKEEYTSMNEETNNAVVVSEDYTKAVTLTRRIIANAKAAQQSLYEVCKGLKEMRDGKLYRELGYHNFADYCENEVGIHRNQAMKYASIAEIENAQSLGIFEKIGTEKLYLLAKLDESTREAVTETVDVENTTVKELKAQITALTAERDENEHAAALLSEELDSAKESLASKDKQFKEAMESKDKQLKAAKESGEQSLSECKTFLNGKIHELENRIHELQDQPITHDMTDADAAEEIKRLKRELEDEQLKTIMLEKSAESKANRAADAVRHELTQMHETELQTLREGYEKQLAEESKKPDRSALDRAKFYALKNVFEEIVDELESLLDELHDDPRIRYINELDNYWTDNLLYLKRDGEGAGA